MEVGEAIAGRRSVRGYQNRVPDENLIRSLITAATLAPNALNQQPLAFTVVRDQAVLDAISRDAKAHMLATLRDETTSGSAAGHLRAALGSPDFHIFYHAPALRLISGNAPGPYIVEDCALAAENLMLTAHSAGLGSCWIGFAQGYLGSPPGRKMLGLPDAWVPVAPIIVGYPSAPPAAIPRKAPEVRWVG